MSKRQKFLIVFLAMAAIFTFFSPKAEAKVFTGSSRSPTSYRQLCNGGTPVDFAAYPSDVEFDPSSGKATYNVNLRWKRCTTSSETRAYAVYTSPDICPPSGPYGGGGTTTDCLKYVGNPAYSGQSGLTCPGGTNGQCVDPWFTLSGRVKFENQPSTLTETVVISKSTIHPYWPLAPPSGNWTISSIMCQYYKPGPSFTSSVSNSRCMGISIDISWATTPALGAICMVSGTGTSVPDTMNAGQTYTVTVRVMNVGTSTWNNSSSSTRDQLGSGADVWSTTPGADPKTHRDNKFWSPNIRVPLSSYPVTTGQTRNATFQVTAPNEPGTQPFWWQMLREGVNWFGIPCKKNIEVVIPQNKPYLMVNGGDVISGTSFTRNGQACTPTTNARNAHIRTNGFYGNGLRVLNGSSMAQYAVFASGLIGNDSDYDADNNFLGNYGHKRQTAIIPKDGLFANKELGSGEHGRLYGDPTSGTLPCVNITEIEAGSSGPVLSTSGQAEDYLESPESSTRTTSGSISLGTIPVPAGTKKTLIVNGNLTLTGPITYPSPYANVSQIPYLRIIARGNIYVQTAVQRVDAHLVAYPQTTSVGIIDTCSNISGTTAGTWPTSLTTNSCNPKLIINGSLTARRILWKRTYGTLGNDSRAADPACHVLNSAFLANVTVDNAVFHLNQCAAERIDFNAEAYLGQLSNGLLIDPIPINSAELPPIY